MVRWQDRTSCHRRSRTVGEHSRVLIALGLCVVSAACGYSFVTARGRLADGGTRLCIPMSTSLVTDPQLIPMLTQALREQTQRLGLTCPHKSGGKDEAPTLHSSIRSIGAIPRAVAVFAGRYTTREQEIVLKVRFVLRLESKDEQTWTLSEHGSYLSAPDIRGTEANKDMAIRDAVSRLARRAVDSLARGF